MISDHFSLDEVQHTNTGLPNEIPDGLIANATRLAVEVLEPLRVMLGPLHVNSWFRNEWVNNHVGGELHSYHLDGLAADVVPNGDCFAAFKMALTVLKDLPIDKIIYEKRNSEWLHIQTNQSGNPPRHEALTSHLENGKMVYEHYNA